MAGKSQKTGPSAIGRALADEARAQRQREKRNAADRARRAKRKAEQAKQRSTAEIVAEVRARRDARSAKGKAAWAALPPEVKAERVAKLKAGAERARKEKRRKRWAQEVRGSNFGEPQPAEPIAPPEEPIGRATPNAWEYRESRTIDGRHDGNKLGAWMAELPEKIGDAPIDTPSGQEIPWAVRIDVNPDKGGDVGAIHVLTGPVEQRIETISTLVAAQVEHAARGILYNEGVADARKPPSIPVDDTARKAYDNVMAQIQSPWSAAEPHNFAQVTVVVTPASPADVAAAQVNDGDDDYGDDDYGADEVPF